MTTLFERERDIARTRHRLRDTIGRIEDRLTPSGIADEVLGSVRLKTLESRYGRVLEAVRSNPLPVLVVAAGLGYVLTRIAKRERRGRAALGVNDAPVVDDGGLRRHDPS